MVFVLLSRQCSHKIAAISLSKSPAKSHAAIMTIPVLSPRPCRTADNILFSPLPSTSQNRGCQSVEKAAAMRIVSKKLHKAEEQLTDSALECNLPMPPNKVALSDSGQCLGGVEYP